MNLARIEIPFGGHNLIIESGHLAKQANGAVTVTYGGTVVLVTACMSKNVKEGAGFFPLTVEYQEKTYAAGRIPGGFFKREGRPSESEILAARVIDRPIRPLFPEGFLNDVQVVALVLSSDGEYDPDILALTGASAALMISDIPFDGPVAAARVGMIDGEFVLNPSYADRGKSLLDIIVVGYKDQVIMIEGEAKQVPEDLVIKAIDFALQKIKPLNQIQLELVQQAGKKKTDVPLFCLEEGFVGKVRDLSLSRLKEIYRLERKEDREDASNLLLKDLCKDLSVFSEFKVQDQAISPGHVKMALEQIEYEEVRKIILQDRRRVDGRGLKDIREISCSVNVLPRTHGSGLFSRGQTQSLSIATLGTRADEQMVEDLEGVAHKSFMLHYNFPGFSVGETKPMRGPGRREIGHGALAEKSIRAVMPSKEEFPYTVRVVSEVLESNGSSSMATVCAATLCLMDAGVPLKEPVAGISIGLISDPKESLLLTDIMGVEDHYGDMDFKVAGTKKGVTGIQLDLKIKGVALSFLSSAIEQAKEARLFILDKMYQILSGPREELSTYAPRIVTLHVSQDKIGELIGPGGKNIRRIIEETGVTIDIEDDGTTIVASVNAEGMKRAVEIIQGMVAAPEIGKIYNCKVKRVTNFGAFCEFLPGKDGLVHVSEFSNEFVKDISKVVKVGDEFKVKVIEIDELNRVNLSKKQAE